MLVITSKLGGRFPTIGAFVAVGSGGAVAVTVGLGAGVLVGGAVGVCVRISDNGTTVTIAIVTLRTVTTPAASSSVTPTTIDAGCLKLWYPATIEILAVSAVLLDSSTIKSVVPGNKLAATNSPSPPAIVTLNSTSLLRVVRITGGVVWFTVALDTTSFSTHGIAGTSASSVISAILGVGVGVEVGVEVWVGVRVSVNVAVGWGGGGIGVGVGAGLSITEKRTVRLVTLSVWSSARSSARKVIKVSPVCCGVQIKLLSSGCRPNLTTNVAPGGRPVAVSCTMSLLASVTLTVCRNSSPRYRT